MKPTTETKTEQDIIALLERLNEKLDGMIVFLLVTDAERQARQRRQRRNTGGRGED